MTALPDALLFLLAAAGLLALAGRLLGALFRLGLAAAEKTRNDGLVEASLRSGDLTALAERQAAQGTLRHTRRRSALVALLWAVVLVAPPLLGRGQAAYALCSLLWLLPGRPALPRRASPRGS